MTQNIFFTFTIVLIFSLSALAQTGANLKMSAEEKAKVGYPAITLTSGRLFS